MTSPTPVRSDLPEFSPEPAALPFSARHIGPDAADVARMLEVVGLSSTEELVDRAVPAGIRDGVLDLPAALDETAVTAAPARAGRPQPGRDVDDRPRLLRHPHPGRRAAQRARGPRPGTRPTRRTSPRSPRAGSRRCSTSRPMVTDLTGARRRQRLPARRGHRRRRGHDPRPPDRQGPRRRRVRGRRRLPPADHRRGAHPRRAAGRRGRRAPTSTPRTCRRGRRALFGVLLQYPGASGRVRDLAAVDRRRPRRAARSWSSPPTCWR